MEKKNTVIKIEEYRCYLGIDHVLVGWGDGTSSWERLESLNCKMLMLSFIDAGISYLQKKEEVEILENQKKKEAEMLQKLIDRNKKAVLSTQAPSEVPMVGIKPAPVLATLNTLEVLFRKNAYDNRSKAANNARLDMVHAGPAPLKAHSTIPKDTAKANTISIYDSTQQVCNFSFYYKKNAPNMSVDISQLYFSSINNVATRVYSLYLRGSERLETYFGDVFHDFKHSEFKSLKSTVLNSNLVVLYVIKETCWIFDFSFKLSAMLGLKPCGGVFILKVEGDPCITRLARFKNTTHSNALWDESKYATPVRRTVGHLFSGESLPFNLPGVFVGDIKTAVGKYMTMLIKEGPGLASTLGSGCSIVVQDGYLMYLHQVPHSNLLFSVKNRFFNIHNFNVAEVLKPHGVFTISSRLMESGDIALISGFLSKLSDREGWKLYVSSAVYNKFKQKAADLSMHRIDTVTLKKAYNTLKNGCVEAQQQDYLSQLRSMLWRENRFFYLIDTDDAEGDSITLSKAIKIIGA